MYNPDSGKYEKGWRPAEDNGFINHGGQGLWQDIENPQTGERSLHEHTLKTVWESCPKDECYFELTDSGKRECTCNKCGAIRYFVVGIQTLLDGKIVNLR